MGTVINSKWKRVQSECDEDTEAMDIPELGVLVKVLYIQSPGLVFIPGACLVRDEGEKESYSIVGGLKDGNS